MTKTFEGWDEDVWAEWKLKLELLSLEQLDSLAEAVGISFGERKPTAKKEYILVLDEADPDVLEREYTKLTLS